MSDKELTILIPCLHEAGTIGFCVRSALDFFERYQIDGEVVVADNGSTDGSERIARDLGARTVHVAQKGYGAALLAGIKAARGHYVIMGDADGTYDFSRLDGFIEKLRDGADLVMGNRFKGGISRGAMPPLHRYVGNPVLSYLGRLFFSTHVGDFHCGLRGFNAERIRSLHLATTGMEFASEMVVRAVLAGYRVEEVPTTLAPAGRTRSSHLRTWRDGWRHLCFLLIYSPRWLFLYPGIVMVLVGLIGAAALLPGPVQVGPGVELDIHTFVVAAICILLGAQFITFGAIAQRHATRIGLLPLPGGYYNKAIEIMTQEYVMVIGIILAAAGLGGLGWSLSVWAGTNFGPLTYPLVLRVLVVSLTAVAVGVQVTLTVFLARVLEIRTEDREGR
jgi:hypothetical protein